jgi:UDP-N-acetyl-2-amino-2-deoxyglucuronate dehydrogenase
VSQKPGIYTKIHIHGSNGASVGAQTDSGATFIAGMSGVGEPALNDLWTIPGEEHLLAEFQAQDREAFAKLDATSHYHLLQIREFLQAVASGRSPQADGREGRKVVEIITGVYASGRRA